MITEKILKEVVNCGKEYTITVQGNSMKPTIKSGEQVVIKKLEDLKVGDIVLFTIPNELVLHRVVEIHYPYIVTQGDNHPYSDHYIRIDNIIGMLKDERKPSYKIDEVVIKYKGITFVAWNCERLEEDLKNQLNSYGINLISQRIPETKLNIAIIPGANAGKEHFIDILQKHKNSEIAIHFNARISNSPREGYITLNNFTDYCRLGNRISGFQIGCEASMYMALGMLL